MYDWERETEQALVFAVDMAADVARAASRDDLADALDYSSAAQTIKTVVIEGKFRLIETAAERVAQRLIADFDLTWVRVEVVKPIPSEGYTAAITIERTPRCADQLIPGRNVYRRSAFNDESRAVGARARSPGGMR